MPAGFLALDVSAGGGVPGVGGVDLGCAIPIIIIKDDSKTNNDFSFILIFFGTAAALASQMAANLLVLCMQTYH